MKHTHGLVSVLGVFAALGLGCGDGGGGGDADETSGETGTNDDDPGEDLDDDDDDDEGIGTETGSLETTGDDSGPSDDGADSTGECPTTQLLLDPGFEDGLRSDWEQFSALFDTPICDGSCFMMGGSTAAYEGQWWVWFGGTSNAENAYVAQEVTIPEGFATLSFYLSVPTEPIAGEDVFRVELDDDVLFEITDLDGPDYGVDYVQVVLDVTGYADGGVHTLRLESENPAHPNQTTNFFVDLVELSTACDGDPTDTGDGTETGSGTGTGSDTTGTGGSESTSGTESTGGTDSTGASESTGETESTGGSESTGGTAAVDEGEAEGTAAAE